MAMSVLQTLQDKFKDQGLEILSVIKGSGRQVSQFISRKKYGFMWSWTAMKCQCQIRRARHTNSGAGDKNGIIQWLEVGYDKDETGLAAASRVDQTIRLWLPSKRSNVKVFRYFGPAEARALKDLS